MEYFHNDQQQDKKKKDYLAGVSQSMVTWQHTKAKNHVPMKYFRVEVFQIVNLYSWFWFIPLLFPVYFII